MRRRIATAHGFRSSFRDWASENGYTRDYAERALAPLKPHYAAIFNNLILEIAALGICMYALSRTIHVVEDRLQTTNEKLARFSDPVSDYLDPMLVDELRDGTDPEPRPFVKLGFIA